MSNSNLISRGVSILKKGGLINFIKATSEYLFPMEILREQRLRLQYGRAAPSSDEILYVPIKNINYTFPNSNYPGRLFSFGVKGGDWDVFKQQMSKSSITIGIKQRFAYDQSWIETEYYRYAMDHLDSNSEFTPLPSSYEQNEEGLLSYFDSLDQLFETLQQDGFKKPEQLDLKDMPKAHIGRNGEFILTHGHHRTVMCDILDIDIIPVRIAVRHLEWQKHRQEVMNSSNITTSHPDLIALLNSFE